MAKLPKIKNSKKNNIKKQSAKQRINDELKKKQREIRNLKKENKILNQQVEKLNLNIENINFKYLETAQVSVDLLSDLEYHKYKSSFIDININSPSGYKRLKKIVFNLKNHFLNDLKCCYFSITYTGINKSIRDNIIINSRKKYKHMPGFLKDRCKLYSIDFVDRIFPERKIGRITIGKVPYKDKKKEKDYNKKMEAEIQFSKRVIENSISDVNSEELAVKDALTGLYNRKYLDEKLTDEFNSLDQLQLVRKIDRNLLAIILKADASPYDYIRSQFFIENNTNDMGLFQNSIKNLLAKNMIEISKDIYLGELIDFCYFKSSKISYNLFVALFDLDHFKDVNDNWGGHAAGDQILLKFAKILKKYIRTTDIAVRYGGEEFVIMFPRADSLQKIYDILEKIRLDCENNLKVKYRGNERIVTVSVGLTRISKFDSNIQQILSRTDGALYTAKRVRNRIIIYEQEHSGYKRISQ